MAPVIAETAGCIECGAPAWIEALLRPEAEMFWFCRTHAYLYMKIEAALREGPGFDDKTSGALRRLCAQAVFAGRYHLPLRLLPPVPIEFRLHTMSIAVRAIDAQWGLMIRPRVEQADVIVAYNDQRIDEVRHARDAERTRAHLVGWVYRVEIERCARIRKGGPEYHVMPVERLRPIDVLESVCRGKIRQ